MNHAYIADAVRTPRGRATTRAACKSVKPAVLLAQALRALAQRTSLDTARVNDAVFGCVTQTADQGASVGTMALPLAGWSDAVSAVTINRYCASGLSATHFAALQALHGDTLAVGGGIEMMSRVPMGSDQGPLTHDPELQLQAHLVPIGIAADAIATQRGYTARDARCVCRHVPAARRSGCGTRAAPSMVPVTGADGSGPAGPRREHPPGNHGADSWPPCSPHLRRGAPRGATRASTHSCAATTSLGAIDHVHHAGNSPALADAAAAVLVGSQGALQAAGLRARARILGMADTGSDRTLALTGTVDAARLALARAGPRAGHRPVRDQRGLRRHGAALHAGHAGRA
jgi:acetyl-CoA C-acetyltransferase